MVITLSMFDTDICEKFQSYFRKNQTCAFIGSSGVGKSTLINRLLGDAVIETQEIGRDDKGRHTTTGREMFPCPLGGVAVSYTHLPHRRQGVFAGAQPDASGAGAAAGTERLPRGQRPAAVIPGEKAGKACKSRKVIV